MKPGSVRATYDDVNLILKLYEMRRDEKLRAARAWFTANFKVKSFEDWQKLCPPGSDANASYRMVTTYWEMVASFVTGGVLHPELFYQSGRELLFCYERVRDLLPELRDAYKNPTELRNLEMTAKEYIAWWNAQAPGAYEAFSKRVRG
ncbi:MAG TPA: hypothetical protein VKD69_15715 [Vicinamibacterales bacterium]|nr:hypothetical protein [Vicinamibacterales bacterium]